MKRLGVPKIYQIVGKLDEERCLAAVLRLGKVLLLLDGRVGRIAEIPRVKCRICANRESRRGSPMRGRWVSHGHVDLSWFVNGRVAEKEVCDPEGVLADCCLGVVRDPRLTAALFYAFLLSRLAPMMVISSMAWSWVQHEDVLVYGFERQTCVFCAVWTAEVTSVTRKICYAVDKEISCE